MKIECFIPMIPPTVTHQEKSVKVVHGKPVFYEPEKLKGANLIFIYLLVASTAEAVFTNSTGVFSAVLLALYFRKDMKETERQPGLFVVRF